MNFLSRIPRNVLLGSIGGSMIGVTILLKEHLGGPTYCPDNGTLKDKVVIVTGANSGIGQATVKECAQRKANVIMACRDMKKCEKTRLKLIKDTKHVRILCKECDLASQDSIRKFADHINKSEPNVFALVNNAGVMRCRKSLTKEGIENQLGTNHMGHFLLTSLLLDKLKASAPSRIVTVTSGSHNRGEINFEDLNSEKSYDPGFAYNQSKLANVLFTQELSRRLGGSDVACYTVDPGVTSSKITRHMSHHNNPITGLFIWPVMWILSKTPRQAAQTTLFAMVDPGIEEHSGALIRNNKITKLCPQAKDETVAKRLWATSEQWTGVSTSDVL